MGGGVGGWVSGWVGGWVGWGVGWGGGGGDRQPRPVRAAAWLARAAAFRPQDVNHDMFSSPHRRRLIVNPNTLAPGTAEMDLFQLVEVCGLARAPPP